MVSAQTGESGEESVASVYRKRFVSSPSPPDEADRAQSAARASAPTEANSALMSPRAVISSVAMAAAALLCFAFAAGFSGDTPGVREETRQQMLGLRERIQTAEAKAESLPDAEEAEDALAQAKATAEQVAQLQNDYRYLTPRAAAGVLGPGRVLPTRRNLVPLFSPNVERSALKPWYLLAADTDVPAGIGIALGFDSGFVWVAQIPRGIEDDGTIEVIWLAVQTRSGRGETSAVLALAQASYDVTRRTFSDLETGTTATGEALRLKVNRS